MDFQINILAIFITTFIQYVIGALWFSPLLFGKLWAKIMNFDLNISKEKMAEIQKEMMSAYAIQLFTTLTMNIVISIFINNLSNTSSFLISGLILIGITTPVYISSVLWGNTKKEFWGRQISVVLLNHLVNSLISALIIGNLVK